MEMGKKGVHLFFCCDFAKKNESTVMHSSSWQQELEETYKRYKGFYIYES